MLSVEGSKGTCTDLGKWFGGEEQTGWRHTYIYQTTAARSQSKRSARNDWKRARNSSHSWFDTLLGGTALVSSGDETSGFQALTHSYKWTFMEGDSLQMFAVETVGRHDPKLAVDEAFFTFLILSYDASTIPICCGSAMQSQKSP